MHCVKLIFQHTLQPPQTFKLIHTDADDMEATPTRRPIIGKGQPPPSSQNVQNYFFYDALSPGTERLIFRSNWEKIVW